MRLNMTNGKRAAVQIVFAEDTDRKDCMNIRKSPRPVSTAMTIAKKRYPELASMHPVTSGYALEGL